MNEDVAACLAEDHEMNVYLSAADGFRKFDMDGKLMCSG